MQNKGKYNQFYMKPSFYCADKILFVQDSILTKNILSVFTPHQTLWRHSAKQKSNHLAKKQFRTDFFAILISKTGEAVLHTIRKS